MCFVSRSGESCPIKRLQAMLDSVPEPQRSGSDGHMSSASGKPRKWVVRLLFLFTGACAGCVLTFLAFAARGLAEWGEPTVLSDADVHNTIIARGVPLPPSANDLYFSIAGFADHTEFIAFTAPVEDSKRAVEEFIRKHACSSTSLKAGTVSEYGFINEGPAGFGEKWRTPQWDISEVKDGLMYEEKYVFALLDKDSGRAYISTWSE